MPLFTGQERKLIRPHKLGRWYELPNGALFRLHEQPRRVFEGPDDPERYVADVELLSGGWAPLIWRFDTLKILSPLWPTWLLRLVKPNEGDVALKLLAAEEQKKEESHG
jgi:hypothetical protein